MNHDYIINKFTGLDRKSNRWGNDLNVIHTLENAYIKRNANGTAVIQQRNGLEKISASSPGMSSLDWVKIHKNGDIRACDDNGNWYYWGGGTALEWVQVTLTNPRSGIPAWYNGYVYYPTSGQPQRHGSNDLTSDTTVAATTVFCVHKNRMACGGGSNVYLSKVNDATTSKAFSTEGDSIKIDLNLAVGGSASVVAMESIGDNLYIICHNCIVIYKIVPEYDECRILGVFDFSGIVSQNGYFRIGNEIYIATINGLTSLSKLVNRDALYYSDHIQPLWEECFDKETSSPFSWYCKAYIGVEPNLNQLLITIRCYESSSQGGSYTIQRSRTLVFDLNEKLFVGEYIVNDDSDPRIVKFMGALYRSSLNSAGINWGGDAAGRNFYATMFAVDDNGNLYRMHSDQYTDNGNTIKFKFKPHYIGTESSRVLKSLKEISMLVKSYSGTDLDVSVNIDPISNNGESTGSDVTETIDLISGTGFYNNNNFIGRFRQLDLTVEHDNSGERLAIGDINIKTVVEGEK